ncbi:MAG TPA: hypothetical protein PK689_07885, partial [Kiritimatiellia bacterium]|nr:hypothetical protein [Kiritimatiellia bacterium]
NGIQGRDMTTRRKAAGVALKLRVSLGVFAVGLEIAFRICPWAVPAKALVHFEPVLRAQLAQGRFPTRADTILLPRDDGGDAIRIFKPFAVKPYGLRSFDTNNCGAVREVKTDEIGFGNPPGIYESHPASICSRSAIRSRGPRRWTPGTPGRSGWAKGWDARRTIWAGAATVRTNTCRS